MNNEWIQLLTVGTNITIIITGYKIIRHLSRMELKVEMMWTVFMRRFAPNESDKRSES